MAKQVVTETMGSGTWSNAVPEDSSRHNREGSRKPPDRGPSVTDPTISLNGSAGARSAPHSRPTSRTDNKPEVQDWITATQL